MPIAVPRSDNTHTLETFTAPIVPDSPVPGLLGLESMTTKRTIIDAAKNQLITLGPGDYSIQLPPGSEVYQCKRSPSGHLVLPVSSFNRVTPRKPDQTELKLFSDCQSSGPSPAPSLPVIPEQALRPSSRTRSESPQKQAARSSHQ